MVMLLIIVTVLHPQVAIAIDVVADLHHPGITTATDHQVAVVTLVDHHPTIIVETDHQVVMPIVVVVHLVDHHHPTTIIAADHQVAMIVAAVVVVRQVIAFVLVGRFLTPLYELEMSESGIR